MGSSAGVSSSSGFSDITLLYGMEKDTDGEKDGHIHLKMACLYLCIHECEYMCV